MAQHTYHYSKQWDDLLNAIGGGDTTAVATAINTVKSAIDDLTDAVQNQTLTLDFSNLNSDAVSNLSNVTGDNVSYALDNLKSDLTNMMYSKTDILNAANKNCIRLQKIQNLVTINTLVPYVITLNEITIPQGYRPNTTYTLPLIVERNIDGYTYFGSVRINSGGSFSNATIYGLNGTTYNIDVANDKIRSITGSWRVV